MQWFDPISLPAMIVLPLMGAVFLLFIPQHEFGLRKRVAILVITATGFLHLRNSILLFRDHMPRLDLNAFTPLGFNQNLFLIFDRQAFFGLSFLLIALFLFLHCALSKNIQAMQLDSKILFLLSLCCALMLTANFGVSILGQLVITQAILIFNLREGGPRRSSSSLAASISFILLDLTAYCVWRWESDLLALEPTFISFIVFLPMITRLLVPFFSPWVRLFFANSSIEITILYLCTCFIPALIGLARYHAEFSFLSPVALIAALFAALLAVGDKHLSQFLLRLMSAGGALALYLFSSPLTPEAESQVLAYCGTLTLLVCLGLLIQRTLSEELPERFEKGLRPIWYSVLMLLGGVPFFGVGAFVWQIFPATSLLWIATFALLTFGIYSRVREAPTTTHQTNMPSIYTRATIANLWSCVGLVILTTLSFQLLFSEAVLPT